MRRSWLTWARMGMIKHPERAAARTAAALRALLASELVANAAEHAPGSPIGFAVRLDSGDGVKRGVTCEVTDASPALPKIRQADADQERGRGMAIVNALADTCGVRAGPDGKTTWFTLALHDRINRVGRQAEIDPEAGT